MGDDVKLELICADPAGALSALTDRGLELRDVAITGPLTVRLCVSREDLAPVEAVLDRRGDRVRTLGHLGPWQRFRSLLRHRVLLAGLALLTALTVWIPTRVLFIQVEGNARVEDRLILEKLEELGLGFGADRGQVRSEQFKNALLEALPQLQWAGINTAGCVATVIVEERSTQALPETGKVGHVVAVRDGVVTSITASKGLALCRVGQAVRAGEVLISGYQDCGGVILAQCAEGEVYGQTTHSLEAKTLDDRALRGAKTASEIKFSLIFGKNRINFYKDSGILDGTCVRMYEEYYMTLPGGFQLPVVLVREQWDYYDTESEALEDEALSALLSAYAGSYLKSRMVAGQVLEGREQTRGPSLTGQYFCLELIGQVRYEENTDSYGQNHGKNS